jgi:hypothetical protein
VLEFIAHPAGAVRHFTFVELANKIVHVEHELTVVKVAAAKHEIHLPKFALPVLISFVADVIQVIVAAVVAEPVVQAETKSAETPNVVE